MDWSDETENRETREHRIAIELAKRRARGEKLEPLLPTHKTKICISFWGRAWCQHLAACTSYAERLPQGRTDLRKGKVLGLKIRAGEIEATVLGDEIYDVLLHIDPLDPAQWETLKESCAGKIDQRLDLLEGKLSDSVMAALIDHEEGLFPLPSQIHVNCTCPDYADLCRHATAVLYAVGITMDEAPEKLFELREVDPVDLIDDATLTSIGDFSTPSGILCAEELSALFNIEITEPETAFLDLAINANEIDDATQAR